jgi:hypothetical protein
VSQCKHRPIKYFNSAGAEMSALIIAALVGASIGYFARGLCMNAVEPDRL